MALAELVERPARQHQRTVQLAWQMYQTREGWRGTGSAKTTFCTLQLQTSCANRYLPRQWIPALWPSCQSMASSLKTGVPHRTPTSFCVLAISSALRCSRICTDFLIQACCCVHLAGNYCPKDSGFSAQFRQRPRFLMWEGHTMDGSVLLSFHFQLVFASHTWDMH